MVFVLCTLFDHPLYLYQVSQKYLKEFQSCDTETIPCQNLQRGVIPSKCDKVMVLNL